jgi:hypothetical protein
MISRLIAFWGVTAALHLFMASPQGGAAEFLYGCRSRPACGKVCKLVPETKELVVTCYGCECDHICIPPHSKPGCKHCSSAGCNAVYNGLNSSTCDAACTHQPKCEFCWRDWIACGCAKPRQVKVLTKYEAVKEICWYHWEVVDAASCGCDDYGAACTGVGGDLVAGGIYKSAPADAELGAVIPLSESERQQLAVLKVNQTADAVGAPQTKAAGAEGVPAADDVRQVSWFRQWLSRQ